MTTALKIMAIDDQPLFAHGMQHSLKPLPFIQQVDWCNSYDQMQRKIKEDVPHLLFMELNLTNSRHNGFTICKEITSTYKNIFVTVFSRHNSTQVVNNARQCGAHAFIDKNTGTEILHRFIHDVWSKNITDYYVCVNRSNTLQQADFKPEPFELKQLLTKRELELMQLIITGKEIAEIKQALSISYETLRFHRNNLLQKMGVKNDVQLTRFALEHNLEDKDFAVSYIPVPHSVKLKAKISEPTPQF